GRADLHPRRCMPAYLPSGRCTLEGCAMIKQKDWNRQPEPRYLAKPMAGVSATAFQSRDDAVIAMMEPFFGSAAQRLLARSRADNVTIEQFYTWLRQQKIPSAAEGICQVYKASRPRPRPRLLD